MESRSQSGRSQVVVALIATRGRFDLLCSRALPSVLVQKRLPDRLVIVVDKPKTELSERQLGVLARRLRSQCEPGLPVTVLRNRRTESRAAGAWNTGIDHLHRELGIASSADQVFVAILDDDDAWTTEHVATCLDTAVASNRNMVASGLIRHESPSDPGHRHSIPCKLDVREQFIQGQHIQASNLFVRLDMLLLAGGFDEHLPSCTDRDLCIRLSRLPSLRFGSTSRHTVHHHADDRPDRLSAPGSKAKHDGLTRFWRKHATCFDEAARESAAERARIRFGWTPPSPRPLPRVEIPPVCRSERAMAFVIGFVTDALPKAHVGGLLEDLLRLQSRADVSVAAVVIVENGPLPGCGTRPLHDLVRRFQDLGLPIELVTIERQHADWSRGFLVDSPDSRLRRLPMAVSRTTLNTYVGKTAGRFPGAAAWILDDDKRLAVRVDIGGATVERETPDVAVLTALRDGGADAVIGPDTDAPPLPFTATLRMQLIDLQRHMAIAETRSPESPWTDESVADAASLAALCDIHYDLARTTEHLETPFAWRPSHEAATQADAIGMIADRAGRLLAGESLFRPLVLKASSLASDGAEPTAQRGGSTIFFNPEHLLAYPQNLARLGDGYVRRSDMLATVLMRDQMGLRFVRHAAAAVRHDRSCTTPVDLDDDALVADILGYALYRALDEIMQGRTVSQRRERLLAWSSEELRRAVVLVQKYVDERLASCTQSAWRVRGLADGIRCTARRMANGASAWNSGRTREELLRIAAEMDKICETFSPSAVATIAGKVNARASQSDIRAAFKSMDGLINEYRSTRLPSPPPDRERTQARERRARSLLERAYGVRALRVLGAGNEGIVFTDRRRVFKVLDLLKHRPNHDTAATLTALAGSLKEPRYLYPLERVDVREETLVVVYPFEESEPFTRELCPGIQMIELLRECRSNGIIFRNMSPKNLRVSATGLKLIDYGSDIRPYSDEGFRAMAERAWLTWRWAHRPDLDQVMRRALANKQLPELDGFDRFWMVLNDVRPSATLIVSAIVDPLVLESGATRVLDYGCGRKAHSARHLAQSGLSVVGYDPAPEVEASWRNLEPLPSRLVLTSSRNEALAGGPFDAVISSLVLCELGDEAKYEQALADITQATRPGGLAIITVCHPHGTFGPATPMHRSRELPQGASYEDVFSYTKLGESGVRRIEHHRPLARIERDLLWHGLFVERKVESNTVDIERFEPSSDFLTLVCRRRRVSSRSPSVSLLIKTCAMEAATIERQVVHLVTQLEGPRTLCERVLVLDSLPDGFARQHAPGDMPALVRAAERLRRSGHVDRILTSPGPGLEARRILREWFDYESDRTHSGAGAPLVAPLWGLEQCRGDYVLQVDSDILVRRTTRTDDYLGEMIEAIDECDGAITASLSVLHRESQPFTASRNGLPWRVEVRGCLLHRQRLLAARPFPNPLVDGVPTLSWQRSMDQAVRQGRIASLRGASAGTGFVHPQNDLKPCVNEWMLLLDLVEHESCPPEQIGRVDLVGGPLEWLPRNRCEPFVMVVTGRNVPPGRIRRCLGSMASQRRTDWGAVIVDDGSETLSREALQSAIAPWKERITLIQPRERLGQMMNMVLAIRHVCTNPNSIIVTLDLDDALIGSGVLDRVAEEYARGAEVTVGSMLRTDKHAEYPVNFDSPRKAQGGNVWQHLRTFRKYLFDSIPDEDLRTDGRYIDLAQDWAFMLPIVEMAQRRAWIQQPLYLYEPSGRGKGEERVSRESIIATIVAKPTRSSLRPSEEAVRTC